MSITQRRTSKHHQMRMKGSCSNWSRSILLQETRIRFDVVEERSIDVEYIYVMTFRATITFLFSI